MNVYFSSSVEDFIFTLTLENTAEGVPSKNRARKRKMNKRDNYRAVSGVGINWCNFSKRISR